MPRCSHRRQDHRGNSEFHTRKLALHTRFDLESGSIDPGFRTHNYATTYHRPFPGSTSSSPPALFFFWFIFFHPACESGVRPTVNNSTALGLFPPCVCATKHQYERSHLSRLAIPLFPVPSGHAPGTDGVPFARDFRIEVRGGTMGDFLV
jgi:hypothetical protein